MEVASHVQMVPEMVAYAGIPPETPKTLKLFGFEVRVLDFLPRDTIYVAPPGFFEQHFEAIVNLQNLVRCRTL